jgi:cytochrome c oxidase cbb3-type subunit 3
VILFILTAAVSCKREQRVFSVSPAEAAVDEGNPNTAQHAGGTAASATTNSSTASRAPQPDLDSNAYDLSQGKQLYQRMNCAGCHANGGGGSIGPALSDDVWIYGWHPQIIFDSIVFGRPNGMPSFGGRMTDHQVWQLVGYVRSLSGIASSQATPGRGDEMTGAPPPNSIGPAHPMSSTAERDELQQREKDEFHQLGWMNPQTHQVQIPAALITSATQPATTRAAPAPSTHRSIR